MVKRYYKYEPWTQPVFGTVNVLIDSNTSYNLLCSHETSDGYAYKAYNASQANDSCWWADRAGLSESNPCWITLFSTDYLRLNKVTVQNEVYTPANFKTCLIQASNDNNIWTTFGEITGTNVAGAYHTLEFENQNAYRYYRVYFTASFTTGISIQTITWEGEKAVETDSSNYDVVIEDGSREYFSKNNVVRKYYKRTIRPWEQPVATIENQNISSDFYIWTPSQGAEYPDRAPYRSFDKINSTKFGKLNRTEAALNWRYKNRLRITKIHQTPVTDYPAEDYALYRLFGSNDGVTWIELARVELTSGNQEFDYIVENPDFYDQYAINVHGGHSYAGTGELTITADEEVIEEGTETDYDFYADEPYYSDVVEDNSGDKYISSGVPNVNYEPHIHTISDGIMYVPSGSNAIFMPGLAFNSDADFELQLKVKLQTYSGDPLIAFFHAGTFYHWLDLYIYQTQIRIYLQHTPNKSAEDHLHSTTLNPLNVWQTYRLIREGSNFSVWCSLDDGKTFEQKLSFASGTNVWEAYPYIPLMWGTKGWIDLNHCYLKQDGEYFWRGMKYVTTKEDQYAYKTIPYKQYKGCTKGGN